MRISKVLQTKGKDVVQIGPNASVREAAGILSEKRIGAIIVADGGAPLGILSERDVVSWLGREGAGCLERKVNELMTAKLTTCGPEDTLLDVLEKMTDGRFRHMPVMEGDTMVGLVSIGDVVKARLSQLAMERDALEDMVKGY
ncbi:CBS domain-containing protein [Palleronia caenipelagi]|uniref:CBS domain-containing protein n=1 Tax=Palleronia caenipelagi TaxID=2489174 RepID=A0A547PXT5_9RHOB|nr:CBS domain-containing protein [Palleronia caenipelagi]TRD18970.1 CBS domain-containing protein [Palleronia caenipelagi]